MRMTLKFMRRNQRIRKLYLSLKSKYGKPHGQWLAWCKRPKTEKEKEEVVIGAILTQRTNWRNVNRAMNNLKDAKLGSLRKIANLNNKNRNRLVSLMRPSGFYRQKTEYLISLAKFVVRQYGGIRQMSREPLPKLRKELLAQKGVGPETADSILLYALDKPVFVIDEYTRRLLKTNNLQPTTNNAKYENLRELFEKSLRRDFRLYQDFHALIVIDGKKQQLTKN